MSLTMRQLLYNMRKTEASDLHLKVGLPPAYRINGELISPPGLPPLAAEDTKRLLTEIIPEKGWAKFEEFGDLDFSTYQQVEAAGEDPISSKPDRFRCYVFRGPARHLSGEWFPR